MPRVTVKALLSGRTSDGSAWPLSARCLLPPLLRLAQPPHHLLVLHSVRCPTLGSRAPAIIDDRHISAAIDNEISAFAFKSRSLPPVTVTPPSATRLMADRSGEPNQRASPSPWPMWLRSVWRLFRWGMGSIISRPAKKPVANIVSPFGNPGGDPVLGIAH